MSKTFFIAKMNRKTDAALNSDGDQEPQTKRMKCCNSLETIGVTKVEKIRFSYKWVIENFEDVVRKPGECIKSSTFSSDSKKEDEWCLHLYPNGQSKEDEGYLSIYLALVSTDKTEEKVTWHVSIRNSNDSVEERLTGSKTFKLQERSNPWGWRQFIKRDVFFEETSKLLPNGTLTINCEIEKEADIITTTNPTPIQIPNSTLADQLGLAVQNETFGDVLFKMGKSEFRAMKGILAARSPVFAGMFSHENMKENQTNQVDIEDIKEDVFRELLFFIYTDTAPNLNEMPEELLAAAEKYQLDRLKIMCEKALYEKISVDNVVEIFVLSEMHNAEKLKKETLKFMKGREAEIFKTNGYKSLLNSNNHRALKLCEMLLIGEHMLTLENSPAE